MKCAHTQPTINGKHGLLDQLFAAQKMHGKSGKKWYLDINCQSYMQRGYKREVAETECNTPDALQTGLRSCLAYVTAATVHHVRVHILKCITVCSLLKADICWQRLNHEMCPESGLSSHER